MRKLFIVILIISLCVGFAECYGQISDTLYRDLPVFVKPANKNSVTLKEKAKIIEGLAPELVTKYSKELNAFVPEIEKEMLLGRDKRTQVQFAFSLGIFYTNLNNFPKGFEYLKKTAAYAGDDTAYKKTLAETYSMLASYHVFGNNADSAMKCLAKALDFGDRKDSVFLGSIYATYASIYTTLRLFSQAIYYTRKTIETMPLANKMQDEDIRMHIEIAVFYTVLFRDSLNASHADSAQKIIDNLIRRTKSKARYWYSGCYFSLGFLDECRGRYKEAVASFDSSLLPGYLNQNLVYGINSVAKVHRAVCLTKLGDRDAVTFLDSLQLGANDFATQQVRYKALYEYAKLHGFWEKSLGYHESYIKFTDSLSLIANRARVFEANQKYAVAQKEAAIAELENTNLKEKNEKKAWVIVSLLAVIIVILLYLYYRQKLVRREQDVKLLNYKLEEIEKEMTLKQMQQLAENEQALMDQRQHISRDMHDEVSSSVASLRFLINNMLASARLKETKSALTSLGGEVNQVYIKVRDFMHRLHKNNIAPEYNVTDFLNTLPLTFGAGSSLRIRTEFDQEKIEQYFTAKQHTEAYLFLKEAVSNCIRHATASSLLIKINIFNSNVYIDIRDDGKGFNNVTLGIGLESMQQRIKSLGGEVKFISSGGLQVTANFPVVSSGSNV